MLCKSYKYKNLNSFLVFGTLIVVVRQARFRWNIHQGP